MLIIFKSIRFIYISGSNNEKGKHNNVLNIPLPAGTNSEEYLNAYEHVLKKLIEFKPEFVLEHHPEFVNNLPVFEITSINTIIDLE